ncbi:MAG: DUF3131 domain-containing protein [Thiotrichaceae bacterium]|nr:DUF3131 domain-containing protein [Thiotrichaceae bacterium]
MNIKQNLTRARSHIIFILAMISAFSLVIALEKIEFDQRVSDHVDVKDMVQVPMAASRDLTADELNAAHIAWQYFKNNTIDKTGMVNSVDNYEASTMWDTASYMMGLISAERLNIIKKDEFYDRSKRLLISLAKMPLYNNKLPNKSYNTQSLAMVDYGNKAAPEGIGWSAIDVGRIMIPLNIMVWNYPELTPLVRNVTNYWELSALLKKGNLIGALRKGRKTDYLQEGRLGYEEYAAKSLQLMGLDVSTAIDYKTWLNYIEIHGLKIPTDARTPEEFHAHNYVVSEPYILGQFEYGWDQVSKEFAERVYLAQQRHYELTDELTAVSEDNIDQPPYFVYNTVFTDGKAWNTITDTGADASEFKTISTKAVFGWHMIFENDYTRLLMATVKDLHDPKRGWYSGQYQVSGKPNKAITANTNGIILESLAYKKFGSLISMSK